MWRGNQSPQAPTRWTPLPFPSGSRGVAFGPHGAALGSQGAAFGSPWAASGSQGAAFGSQGTAFESQGAAAGCQGAGLWISRCDIRVSRGVGGMNAKMRCERKVCYGASPVHTNYFFCINCFPLSTRRNGQKALRRPPDRG